MNLATSFCMDTGQVRTGADRHDTYLKMLQQIVRVTAPVAHGIAAQYPDVQTLVQAFRDKGPTALQHVKVIFSLSSFLPFPSLLLFPFGLLPLICCPLLCSAFLLPFRFFSSPPPHPVHPLSRLLSPPFLYYFSFFPSLPP